MGGLAWSSAKGGETWSQIRGKTWDVLFTQKSLEREWVRNTSSLISWPKAALPKMAHPRGENSHKPRDGTLVGHPKIPRIHPAVVRGGKVRTCAATYSFTLHKGGLTRDGRFGNSASS